MSVPGTQYQSYQQEEEFDQLIKLKGPVRTLPGFSFFFLAAQKFCVPVKKKNEDYHTTRSERGPVYLTPLRHIRTLRDCFRDFERNANKCCDMGLPKTYQYLRCSIDTFGCSEKKNQEFISFKVSDIFYDKIWGREKSARKRNN